MRKPKFGEPRSSATRRDAESGVPIAEVLRKHVVSNATLVT